MASTREREEDEADAAKRPLSEAVRRRIILHLTSNERARADNTLLRSMWRDAAREHISRSGRTLPPNARGPYLTRRVRQMLQNSLEARYAPRFNATGPDPGAPPSLAFTPTQAEGDAQATALRESFAGAPIPVVSLDVTNDDWKNQNRNSAEEAALAQLADFSNHEDDLADELYQDLMGDMRDEAEARQKADGPA